MIEDNITLDKKIMRKKANVITNQLTKDYKYKASKIIVEKLLASDQYKKAEVIFCFVGTENEIDTKPFIIAALGDGKKVGVPLCTGKGIMEAREIKSLDDLALGSYGLWEPKETCILIDKKNIDYGIIPCAACSLEGKRIGFGGGYYDRYLQDAVFHCTLICYDKLVMEEIPVDSHDLTMDSVVTELS